MATTFGVFPAASEFDCEEDYTRALRDWAQEAERASHHHKHASAPAAQGSGRGGFMSLGPRATVPRPPEVADFDSAEEYEAAMRAWYTKACRALEIQGTLPLRSTDHVASRLGVVVTRVHTGAKRRQDPHLLATGFLADSLARRTCCTANALLLHADAPRLPCAVHFAPSQISPGQAAAWVDDIMREPDALARVGMRAHARAASRLSSHGLVLQPQLRPAVRLGRGLTAPDKRWRTVRFDWPPHEAPSQETQRRLLQQEPASPAAGGASATGPGDDTSGERAEPLLLPYEPVEARLADLDSAAARGALAREIADVRWARRTAPQEGPCLPNLSFTHMRALMSQALALRDGRMTGEALEALVRLPVVPLEALRRFLGAESAPNAVAAAEAGTAAGAEDALRAAGGEAASPDGADGAAAGAADAGAAAAGEAASESNAIWQAVTSLLASMDFEAPGSLVFLFCSATSEPLVRAKLSHILRRWVLESKGQSALSHYLDVRSRGGAPDLARWANLASMLTYNNKHGVLVHLVPDDALAALVERVPEAERLVRFVLAEYYVKRMEQCDERDPGRALLAWTRRHRELLASSLLGRAGSSTKTIVAELISRGLGCKAATVSALARLVCVLMVQSASSNTTILRALQTDDMLAYRALKSLAIDTRRLPPYDPGRPYVSPSVRASVPLSHVVTGVRELAGAMLSCGWAKAIAQTYSEDSVWADLTHVVDARLAEPSLRAELLFGTLEALLGEPGSGTHQPQTHPPRSPGAAAGSPSSPPGSAGRKSSRKASPNAGALTQGIPLLGRVVLLHNSLFAKALRGMLLSAERLSAATVNLARFVRLLAAFFARAGEGAIVLEAELAAHVPDGKAVKTLAVSKLELRSLVQFISALQRSPHAPALVGEARLHALEALHSFWLGSAAVREWLCEEAERRVLMQCLRAWCSDDSDMRCLDSAWRLATELVCFDEGRMVEPLLADDLLQRLMSLVAPHWSAAVISRALAFVHTLLLVSDAAAAEPGAGVRSPTKSARGDRAPSEAVLAYMVTGHFFATVHLVYRQACATRDRRGVVWQRLHALYELVDSNPRAANLRRELVAVRSFDAALSSMRAVL